MAQDRFSNRAMKVIVSTYKSDGVRVNERLILNVADESYLSDTASDIEEFVNEQYFILQEDEE